MSDLPRLTTPRTDAGLDREIHRVPEAYRDELLGYLRHGIPPGSFMQAVLENKLADSWRLTDDWAALAAIVGYLHHFAPHPAWGSPFAVREWILRGIAARAAAAVAAALEARA